MPEEKATPEAPEATPAPAGNKRLLTIAGVIVGGLVLGGASGMFAAGPLIAKMGGKPDTTAKPAEEKGGHGGESKPAAGDQSTVAVVDNLVMNPAGSSGTRFLLVTVGMQMKTASAMEEVKSRDTEVRDAILRVLGGKTVEELANITNREVFKRDIINALDSMLAGKKTAAVYFPQFVIQ